MFPLCADGAGDRSVTILTQPENSRPAEDETGATGLMSGRGMERLGQEFRRERFRGPRRSTPLKHRRCLDSLRVV
jgi:hypothetical protein